MDMYREALLTNIALSLIENQPPDMHGILSKLTDANNIEGLRVMAATLPTCFPEENLTIDEAMDILEVLLKEEHIPFDDEPGTCRSIRECTSPFGGCRCLPEYEEVMNGYE